MTDLQRGPMAIMCSSFAASIRLPVETDISPVILRLKHMSGQAAKGVHLGKQVICLMACMSFSAWWLAPVSLGDQSICGAYEHQWL
jgi:hypothetical protein